MKDYLETYRKFNDIKDIADLIEEVEKLRFYHVTEQFQEMMKHIDSLTKKHPLETVIWNAVNRGMPTSYEQAYINAENFLMACGAKLLTQQVYNYDSCMNDEELTFVESMIKPME